MKIVTLCGSMRFTKQMINIALELELEKKYVVLQCAYNLSDTEITRQDYTLLVQIHKKKIDMSDAIYVVNIDGYIGESTRNEIDYALNKGKEIMYYEQVVT